MLAGALSEPLVSGELMRTFVMGRATVGECDAQFAVSKTCTLQSMT